MPVSLALVGMSRVMQHAHIHNLRDLAFDPEPLFRIACVGDKNESHAKTVADALGVEPMTFEAICADSSIQAVLIATPPHTHLELFEKAVAAGKHIFIEKPLTFSISEARRMAELAQAARTVVRVGYMFRHHTDAKLAKERIESGAIGKPLTCLNLVIPPRDNVWPAHFAPPARETGLFGEDDPDDPDRLSNNIWSDNSVHYLNVMQWWFGPVEAVFAHYRQNGPLMMLRYKSGVVATHVFSPLRIVERRDFTVFGSEGMIEVRLHYPLLSNSMGFYHELRADDRMEKSAQRDHSDMYREELVAFASAIQNTETGDPQGLFASGVRDLLTVKAAHRSAKSGKEEAVETS